MSAACGQHGNKVFTFRQAISLAQHVSAHKLIMKGVRKVLQTQCIPDNHGNYLYKTNTKRKTDYYCKLCINTLEIHKPVLLQF